MISELKIRLALGFSFLSGKFIKIGGRLWLILVVVNLFTQDI